MGVANIIQRNIANGCQSIWSKAPSIPSIPVKLDKYNSAFTEVAALFGLYALIKSSLYLTKKSLQYITKKHKIPTSAQLQLKYGDHTWVLVVDCKGNQQYCLVLTRLGFNLILCGQQDDIKIVEDRIMRETGDMDFQIQGIIINWEQKAKDITFYEELEQRVKDFDISIIVMPLINKQIKVETHLQKVPVFEHVYLIARYFLPKLKWRSNTSAIIIPSTPKIDNTDDQHNGVSRAVQSGVDAFGRTLGYELKNTIQVIVARGTPENAISSLGKSNVSY